MSKKCMPLWREAHFQVKMYKTLHVRTTFGSWDVEKVHAVVARSTFRSQKVRTPGSDHFWKMSKKCTPLWREAHFEVNMYKTLHVRATFGGSDFEKVHAVVARSTFRSQNVQNTTCSRHFWRFRFRKSARRCGAKHISKSKCTKHQGFGPLLEVQMSLRFTTLHYITLHYTPQRYHTLHYTTSTTLHYMTLNYTPLHYNYNYTTRLHYTTLHYIPLHSTTLHSFTLHYITLNDTAPQIDR